MNIGIDISQIVYTGTGVGRFMHGLTYAIIEHGQNHTWHFFSATLRRSLPNKLKHDMKQKHISHTHVPLPPLALEYLWNRWHTMPVTRLIKDLDWFITSDWSEPPATCKKATMVHDLAFKRFPETIDPRVLTTMTNRLELIKKESDLIICDSNATKHDLEHYYNIEPKRTTTIYPGVTVTQPTEDKRDEVLRTYAIEKPFLLTVGKIEPRKNIKRLIEAFNSLGRSDIELCIVGPQGWDRPHQAPKNVRFLGFVPDADLYALYTLSYGLVLASLWEGFGYPVIEAMQLKTPVATSDRSSLKEVADGHALLFDPERVESIASALQLLLEKKAKDMIDDAYEHSSSFTWKNYYNALIDQLEKRL